MCIGCKDFDSYADQGDSDHWRDYGYCARCGVTKHRLDECEAGLVESVALLVETVAVVEYSI